MIETFIFRRRQVLWTEKLTLQLLIKLFVVPTIASYELIDIHVAKSGAAMLLSKLVVVDDQTLKQVHR